MNTYQKLLTTCKPTAIVEGSEGFVDGVVGFIQKIIQKILDGLKWIWNFITGGGGNKSTETLSKEVDKAVAELPKKMEEVNKQLDKVVAKAKTVSNKSKDTGRKIDEILSKEKSGKISKDEMFTEFDKVMKGEDLEGEEKADTVKVVKEIEKEFTKVMNENGIKIASGARNEGAAIVIAAALQDKPVPKKTIDTMVGFPYMSNLGMWFCRTTSVIGCNNVEIEGKQARPVGPVNSALKDSCNKVVKTIEDLISILKSIEVSPDVDNEVAKGIVEEWEKFDGQYYRINDYIKLDFELDDNGIKLRPNFNKKENIENIVCVVNYETFKRVTTHTKEYNQRLNTLKNEISSVEKKLNTGLKLIGDKPDSIKDVESFKLVLKVTKEKLEACEITIKLTDRLIKDLLEFGASPMKWLA